MVKTANGPADGPRFIHGAKNRNWSPRVARRMSAEMSSNARDDFSSEDMLSEEEMLDEMFFSPRPEGRSDMTFEEVIGDHDDRINDLRDMAESTETGEEILEAAMIITSDENYLGMLATKRRLNEEIEERNKTFSDLNSKLNDAVADGDEFPEPERLYEEGQTLVEMDEQKRAMDNLLDDYRNLTAETLRRYQEQMDPRTKEFTGDTIGDLIDGGYYETGTREWLEFRQSGLGGSDMGILANTRDTYYRDSMQELWESKTEPISDEQVESQTASNTEVTDAISRGNALEDFIGEMYAYDHPDITVMHNKSTWIKPGEAVPTNFDFLLSRNGTTPDGSLEIKTAKSEEKWGDPEDGLDAVPKNYRAQVLSQCHRAGFSHGAIAVMINETDFRVYSFDMNNELQQEAEKNEETGRQFWERVNNPNETSPFPPGRKRGAFSAKEAGTGMPKEKRRLLGSLARLRGVPIETVSSEYNAALAASGDDTREAIASTYRDSVLKAARSGATYTGIDLETTGRSALRSRIIEVGMVHQSPGTGQVDGGYSSLYGLSPVAMAATGTGPEEVHGITASDISGRPDFQDPGVQSEVLAELKRNRVMVAHNATFEKRYLRAHLKGFAEAEASGEITVFDTMDLTRRAMDTPDATMRSFTSSNGVEYENAHRAKQDAEMMMNAFHNWVESQA